MAENRLPYSIDQLFGLGEDMADGAATHGVAIGLLQNTEARIRTDLDAARAAYLSYSNAKEAKVALTATQAAADSQARAFIGAAKNALTPSLGGSWSASWATAGFIQSLAIPSTLIERMSLLASLRDYFTGHPAKEVAALNVTAAVAGARFTALSDARSAANDGVAAVGIAKAVWLAARKTLEKRMRSVIDELTLLIADDDPRWNSFGLTPPATDTTPDAPEGLILTAGPEHSVLADWADVPNADHYRVYVQVVGVDAGFVDQPGVRTESDATLGPYQPGQTIRVKVSAVNGGLEGPASSVAELVLEGEGGGGGGGGVPAAPGQPTLTALVDGQVHATWSAVPNVLHYNVYRLLQGTDLDYVLAGPSAVPFSTLTGFPPDEIVRVRITAVNAAGESPPGPHAEIETIA